MDGLTAREMLEELGYYCDRNDKKYLKFKNDENGQDILFDKKDKTYCVSWYSCDAGDIDMRLHKIIHNYIEELGWLDD